MINLQDQIANNIITNSIKYYKPDYKINPNVNNTCLKCEIKFLNVQNISQVKMIQIENNILNSKQHNIFCLVETHENIHKMKTNDNISIRIKTRHQSDIPGGGIAVLFNKSHWVVNERETVHKDIMALDVSKGSLHFLLIIPYLSTNNLTRNKVIYSEINQIINNNLDRNIIILGDFNGHTGILGPQKVNTKGKDFLKFSDENNLNILNLDPECTGEITRYQHPNKSVIDFALCNNNIYRSFSKMIIDEDKDEISFSDHNLITTIFNYTNMHNSNNNIQEVTILQTSEVAINNYTEEVHDSIRQLDFPPDIQTFNSILINAQNNQLKKVVKINPVNRPSKTPWVTPQITHEIAKLRQLRKQLRHYNDPEEYNSLKVQSIKQKEIVTNLTNKAVEKHEINITNKIMKDRNRNRKIYQHIKALKERHFNPIKTFNIYDDNGNIITNNLPNEIDKFWTPIYQQHINQIPNKWNQQSADNYKLIFHQPNNAIGTYFQGLNIENGIIRPLQNQITIPINIAEHFDCVMPIYRPPVGMEEPIITMIEVTTQLKKLKTGKAAGPDTIKPELYKYISSNTNIIATLTTILNEIINEGNIPAKWKTSKTILINKNSKPKVSELRPIALTDVSYKILMGIIKDKIFEHITKTHQVNDMQTGATTNRRVVENIHIFQYIMQQTFINKKKLYVLSIDFSKAFDSVNRYSLFKILLEMRLHPKIIEIIAQIYSNDSTSLFLNNHKVADIQISSGIRQGCNLSALLFIFVTYKIINKIQDLKIGYDDGFINIGSLFYMDDGLIFSHDLTNLQRLINGLALNCFEYGLKLNKDKCKIMMVNDKNCEITNIQGIKVCKTIKYLGVLIDNTKYCFNSQKQKIIKDGIKLSNQTYTTLGPSCNRMLIGKTFWKGLALPKLLYASETIIFYKKDLEKLQTFDNRAYRAILDVPIFTAIAYLRGEIGASSTLTRDMKTKILFVKHITNDNTNSILKYIIEKELNEERTEWSKIVCRYMSNLNLENIFFLSINLIKNRINEFDTNRWKEEIAEKTTLTRYKNYKNNIEEIKWFKNGFKYSLMMKARADALKLNWRNHRDEANKICDLCKEQIETLEHFLIDCNKLQLIRNKFSILQRPMNNNKESIISKLLLLDFEDDNVNYYINILSQLWITRNNILNSTN